MVTMCENGSTIIPKTARMNPVHIQEGSDSRIRLGEGHLILCSLLGDVCTNTKPQYLSLKLCHIRGSLFYDYSDVIREYLLICFCITQFCSVASIRSMFEQVSHVNCDTRWQFPLTPHTLKLCLH